MTIANVRLVPRNDYDDATLSTSAAEVVGFEVENTQNFLRNKYLRTTDASTFTITGVLPENRTVSHFSLWRHLCHAGNVKLELFSDAAATTPATPYAGPGAPVSALPYTAAAAYTFSDGSNDPFQSRMPYWLWFAPTVVRAFKITFSGTPAQAYWQVGRIWLGRYYEFAYPVEWGMALGLGDLSDAVPTEAGSLLTYLGESWPTLEFESKWIPATHRQALLNIFEYCLTARDVVVSARQGEGSDEEARHCINGCFERINDIGRTSVNRDSTRFRIRGL